MRAGTNAVLARLLSLVPPLLASFVSAAIAEGANTCPGFPIIRYDWDPASISDGVCDTQTWSELRYVSLNAAGDRYASVGGEMRQRYEYTRNPTFGQDPQDDHGVWLQRFAIYGDLHWSPHVRAVAELQSILADGRAGGPGPTDENRATVQNAFLELSAKSSDRSSVLRLGRQELQLGSARLVSVRDGPNVRRTFDGARFIRQSLQWTVNVLAVRPRDDDAGAFDDETDGDKSLYGVYGTRRIERVKGGVDLYYLAYRNDDASFAQGSGTERRHTLGVRLFGSDSGWHWNWEPMIQFGRFSGADIRAWTVASETGYSWSRARWQPDLTFSANVASGDRDPDDPDLETFNPLFPRGTYFSEDAVLGPLNFYNAHLFLTLHLSPSWALTADYNLYWRLSDDDGVYGPAGQLVRAPSGSDANAVAGALTLTSEWRLGLHWTLTAIHTELSPREFIRETGPSETEQFTELTARWRF